MKPKFIVHRVNTIEQLQNVPAALGVEIDLRSEGKKIILQHDPFCRGESFEKWLDHYHHGMIILNVKEEGLEKTITKMLTERNIADYFFLDVSFPVLISLSDAGINKLAVRFSEYECLETVLKMQGRAQYVWIDCFHDLPLNRKIYDRLKLVGFSLCLVSPELQKHPVSQIKAFADSIQNEGFEIDAVCTKRPDLWRDAILL